MEQNKQNGPTANFSPLAIFQVVARLEAAGKGLMRIYPVDVKLKNSKQ